MWIIYLYRYPVDISSIYTVKYAGWELGQHVYSERRLGRESEYMAERVELACHLAVTRDS